MSEILSLFIYKCRTHLTCPRERNMKAFCFAAQNLDRYNFVLVNHTSIKLEGKKNLGFQKIQLLIYPYSCQRHIFINIHTL